ncbi:uncharacterized protein [Rutidosis leptorrhynchoides]|uniref:uncharacterized protein n=1 Tax=Rutidosis leptorrhynchoides TaxID=125765 RepID=UPI003A993CC9
MGTIVQAEFEKRFPKPQVDGGGEDVPLDHGIQGNVVRREFIYKNFMMTKPPLYAGDPDPLISTGWISDINGCFRTSEYPPDKKNRLASSLLQGNTKYWLDGKIDIVGEEPFMGATFLAKARFCPEYTRNDRLLMEHFLNTLNDDLREKISLRQVESFAKLFAVAKGFESYAPTMVDDALGKRMVKLYGAPSKKARIASARTGSVRKGVSDTSASRCYNCGERGYRSWECLEPS